MTVLTARIKTAPHFFHSKEYHSVGGFDIIRVTGEKCVIQLDSQLPHLCGQLAFILACQNTCHKPVHPFGLRCGARGGADLCSCVQNGAGFHVL